MAITPPSSGDLRAAGVSSNHSDATQVSPARDDRSSEYQAHAQLVHRVQRGDPGADEDLANFVVNYVRYFFGREFGRAGEHEDRAHEVYISVLTAIRNGQLRDPERLVAFCSVVARRQVFARLHAAKRSKVAAYDVEIHQLPSPGSPFEDHVYRERIEVMARAMNQLSQLHREILERFYLKEQDEVTICRDMNLTSTQFRLAKSRAKAKLGLIGQRFLRLGGIWRWTKAFA